MLEPPKVRELVSEYLFERIDQLIYRDVRFDALKAQASQSSIILLFVPLFALAYTKSKVNAARINSQIIRKC